MVPSLDLLSGFSFLTVKNNIQIINVGFEIFIQALFLVVVAVSFEDEGSDQDFQGVVPSGRGLSTMTRPTT